MKVKGQRTGQRGVGQGGGERGGQALVSFHSDMDLELHSSSLGSRH